MTGKTISHYKILEKLGEGGMGVVYKAEDTKLDRFVALKFLPLHLSRDEARKKRFIQEARAASALDHPNICTIHEIDETEDGQTFIAMACYEGEILKDKIQRGPLKFEEAVDIAIQTAAGLAKAHGKGIIHRDIKPANMMITEDGVVKILDFGLAKLVGQMKLTKTGTTMGTVAYMSPEQTRGEVVDHRTDIWALGVVLYEMLTGQLPFKGDYEQAVVYSIMSEEIEPITRLRSGIPIELERIVNKMLAKNQDERYQHVNDILVDLQLLRKKPESLASKAQPSTAKPKQSIAVLPFTDLSRDKDQEYFCDGMSEDIITKLSKIRKLKVIARTSVMRYKNTEKDIKEIGRELGVATILEGSIRKEKNNIRVSAQLISVEDGFHLWADTYDRRLESVFEVQDEVSKAIADALKVELTPEALLTPRACRPEHIDAYEYLLKGMHFINSKYVISHREEDFKAAIRMLKKAAEIDPNYGVIYFDFGWAYQHHYQISGSKKDLKLVIKNAVKAYELYPNLAEANAGIAWVYYLKGEYEQAYENYKRALEINPNLPTALHLIGLFLRSLGLLHEAVEYASRNIELDPFFLPSHSLRARSLLYMGEFEKARIHIEKAIEIEPDNFWSLLNNCLLFIMLKKYDLSGKLLSKAERINPRYSSIQFYKALLFAAQGERSQALALSKNGAVYALLGINDKAIRYIKNEIKKHYEHFQYSYLPLINSPFYDNLRDDARFKEIIEKQKKKYDERLKKYGKL